MAITVNYGNGTSGALGSTNRWTANDIAPATFDWSPFADNTLANYDQNLNYQYRQTAPEPQVNLNEGTMYASVNPKYVPISSLGGYMSGNTDINLAGQYAAYTQDLKKYPKKALDAYNFNLADPSKDAVVDYLHEAAWNATPKPTTQYSTQYSTTGLGVISSLVGPTGPKPVYNTSLATPIYNLGDSAAAPLYKEAADKFGMTPEEVKSLYGTWFQGYNTLADPVKANWQDVRASGDKSYNSVLAGIRNYQDAGLKNKYKADNAATYANLNSLTPDSVKASDTYLSPEYYALHLPGIIANSNPYRTTTASDFSTPEAYQNFIQQVKTQDQDTGGPFNIATEYRQAGGKKPRGYKWNGNNEIGYGPSTNKFNLAQNYLSDQVGKSAVDAGYKVEDAVKGLFRKKSTSPLGGALGIIGAVSAFVPGLQPLSIAANAASAVYQASQGNWLGAALSAFGAAKSLGAFNDIFPSLGGARIPSSVGGNLYSSVPNAGVGAFTEGGSSFGGALGSSGALSSFAPRIDMVSELTNGTSLGNVASLANSSVDPSSLNKFTAPNFTPSAPSSSAFTGGSSGGNIDFTTGDYATQLATKVPSTTVDYLTQQSEWEKLQALATSDVGKAAIKYGLGALKDRMSGENTSGSSAAEAGANELPSGAFGETAKPLESRTLSGLGVADTDLAAAQTGNQPLNYEKTSTPRRKVKYMTAGKAKKEVR